MMVGCLIVTGSPGAGKTTVARLVAERLKRSARVDLDILAGLLINGAAPLLDPQGNWNPSPEGRRQLRLRMINACSIANNFAEAGFASVIDTVVETREELEFLAGRLVVRPFMLVVLAPSLEIAQRRNATRPREDQVSYDFTHTATNMVREISNFGWWLDRRQLDHSGDQELANLLRKLHAYPAPKSRKAEEHGIVVPLQLRLTDGLVLSLISATTVFGTATELNMSELMIESFFPADEATRRYFLEQVL